MINASFIALGAAAISLVVFSFCIFLAICASKRKAASKAAQQDPSEA